MQFAQIEPLPPEHAGKILKGRSFRTFMRLLKGFAWGIVTCLLITPVVIYFGFSKSGPDAPAANHAFAIILFSVFFVVMLFPLLLGQKSRWLKHVAIKEINTRIDKIVNPSDPNARFVEVIPKSDWDDETMPENAADAGFLAVDQQTGTLLFEGDNERYRIPAQAILKCDQDYHSRWVPAGKGSRTREVRYYFVTVTARLPDSEIEIPFHIRFDTKAHKGEGASMENFELLKEIQRANSQVATI